ncbi:Co2+/Mg2+ efflux protein ApaG [Parasphingopyxis algicola]|uniref:Co2+/Mg2+ efflux protein ApaG n=1 Tax=Parasphingopyxis algicola TaxID=2026624 RepID=UPI0015A400EE|nr:Co2+/Mg2+ efflux protein ApaG [Parasphingopyxis algicola]QLC24548.1 Co2+/Mg2+ efflux protein ApaG [Parasphingopyxis algicola]
MNALFPHVAQTEDVIVRVAVSFLPEQSELAKERWFWAYHIRVENCGEGPVQLLNRHWYITDGRGFRQEVEGEGVVGEQPMIGPGEAFDYVSGCPLTTPNGAMEGSYTMQRADGSEFEAAIPRFPLAGPAVTE